MGATRSASIASLNAVWPRGVTPKLAKARRTVGFGDDAGVEWITPPGPALLREPVLIVRQEWRIRLRPPDYDVFDRNWKRVATAQYAPKDEVRSVLAAYGLSHRTAHALRVSDTGGVAVLTVVFPGFRARGIMLIQDAEGQPVGEAVKTKGFQRVRFELTSGGRRVGVVQAMDLGQRWVSVTDDTGEEVARIRTGWEGAPFTAPGRADGYWLEVIRPPAEPLRSLVVAVTVTMQAAVGAESRDAETVVFRTAMIPRRFDRLRRRLQP